MTAIIHLLCGSTGAGKTTYGKALAEELRAVRFSVDEWMSALFWMDAPQPIVADWAAARVERCVGLIWETAVQIARRDVPAVLEIGLTTQAARAGVTARARDAGVEVKLHLLDVSAEERWRRVELRNRAEAGDRQLGFAITRDMFDFVEDMWEPPTEAELVAMRGIRVDRSSSTRVG